MNRRSFVTGLAATLALRDITFADAPSCSTIGGGFGPLARYGAKTCKVTLSEDFTVIEQDCADRCWAASIAGIFGYHGHPITQEKISNEIFGRRLTAQCTSSHGPEVLNVVLNREWTDDNGNSFRAKITGLYDPRDGQASLDNDQVVSELTEDRPLLYCNQTHAMVQIEMEYGQDANGSVNGVSSVIVADPLPRKGRRYLSRREMTPGDQMTYLAAVTVEDLN